MKRIILLTGLVSFTTILIGCKTTADVGCRDQFTQLKAYAHLSEEERADHLVYAMSACTADKGNKSSHYMLGNQYYIGTAAVKKDLEKAFYHFMEAAKDGPTSLMIHSGEGRIISRHKDPVAPTGLARAKYVVAIMYFQGNGIEKNERKATHWMKRAADQGYEPAKKWLESMAAEPKGSNVDNN